MSFRLATKGCAMAHCDVRMSDRANVPVRRNIDSIEVMDTDQGGSLAGLGVVANENIIVATYQDAPRLVQYDSGGNKQWDSSQNDIPYIDENLEKLGEITLETLGGSTAASAMTVSINNIMIVKAGIGRRSGVTAVDLTDDERVWRIDFEEGESEENTFGQFAIVNQNVFFTTRNKRLHKLYVS